MNSILSQKWGRSIQNIGLLVLGILLSVSLIKGIVAINESNKKIEEERQKVIEAKKLSQELEKQVKEIKSQEFTEKEARDKLGLAKPGETVLVLPDEDTLRRLAPKFYEEEDIQLDPNWRKWLKLFL